VEGTPGVTEFRFYDSLFGGTLIGTAPAVPGITNWTTPALATTTSYYVTAFNGVCESWYRQEIVAKINPIANIVVTPSVPEVCGEGNVVQITAGGDFIVDHLVDEDFESGGFDLDGVGVIHNANPLASIEKHDDLKFSVYPNPTSGQINIRVNGEISILKLYDLSGQLILESLNFNQLNLGDFNLAPGLYLVEVILHDGRIMHQQIIYL
jgi:hypothetical protein